MTNEEIAQAIRENEDELRHQYEDQYGPEYSELEFMEWARVTMTTLPDEDTYLSKRKGPGNVEPDEDTLRGDR